jgi:hypothetical protein
MAEMAETAGPLEGGMKTRLAKHRGVKMFDIGNRFYLAARESSMKMGIHSILQQ